jgi:hypothetical protein
MTEMAAVQTRTRLYHSPHPLSRSMLVQEEEIHVKVPNLVMVGNSMNLIIPLNCYNKISEGKSIKVGELRLGQSLLQKNGSVIM